MPQYVEVAVHVPQISGSFDYHLPPELEDKIQPGHLVVVPFGHQQVQGVVLRRVETPAVSETKPVQALLDERLSVTQAQIQLAVALARENLGSLAAFIGLLLPPGLGQQADTLFSLNQAAALTGLTDLQVRLVKLLEQEGPLRGRQIDHRVPHIEWRRSADGLVRKGILLKQAMLPEPGVQPKRVRMVQLAASQEVVEAQMEKLARKGTAALERRQRIMQALLREPGPVEAAWVYAKSSGNLSDLKALAELGLVYLDAEEVWRDPLEGQEWTPAEAPVLTPDQQTAWKLLLPDLQAAADGKPVLPALLHGVTGSGKTEIYMRLVEAALQQGRQAIILVPEIALTPQTVRRFLARFPGKVGLVHSGLSAGERYDTWRRARLGLLPVVVGPRSALFTPLPNLGLVVVDECHDGSYFQAELPPAYNAVEGAILYAQFSGALCVLGSATPSVEQRYMVDELKWKLVSLPRRILAHKENVRLQLQRWGGASKYRPLSGEAEATDLPPVRVVDMRQELKAGHRSIFSRPLIEALSLTLEREQQAILFLNRRGAATYVFCRDCGYSLQCPRCEKVALTYHKDAERLVCHHCGYQRQMPKKCPACGGTRIRQFGTGTERVQDEITEMFPEARVLRWDWETTRTKGAHELILSHFASHRADVLVGTQMLAKGLDLPLVTLVGVVLADVGLHLPDFRAGERTFQVLSQVAGRAGRSPLGGQVILQTFEPDSYVIQRTAMHDYDGFYHQELEYRRKIGYPPFTQLVRLEYRHTDPQRVEREAQAMAGRLAGWIQEGGRRQTELIGPAPCFYGRLDGRTRWQIVLRGPDPVSLLAGRPMGEWRVEVNPQSLL